MRTEQYRMNQVMTPIATALFLASFSCVAMAEKHDHEMEQHGSHEHGAARLTIATTDDGLEVMLESPAANVFGFEHKAKTEAENDAVHEALETLKDGSALFSVNAAAACKLESADVDSAIAEGDDHDDDKHAKHEDDHDDDKHAKHEDDHDDDKHAKHEDDHDDEKHAKHEDDHDDNKHAKHEDDHDDHDDHADEEGSHSDVDATWTYHCDKPDAIQTVTVKLFSAFPKGFEAISVEWISASSAGKSALKEDGMINLQP